MSYKTFKLPKHYDPSKADNVFQVAYQNLEADATEYRKDNNVQIAATDKYKIGLMVIDAQNTFCTPGYELYVQGAEKDNKRLSKFIYENLGYISKVFPTMDTHTAYQIFHTAFFQDAQGNHPAPMTMITTDDIRSGKWEVNPGAAAGLGVSYTALKKHVLHYAEQLEAKGKYALTIWPYHAMLGGVGHALSSIIEEAVFFHSIARSSQAEIEIKGGNPLTENYSVLSPEVLTTADGSPVAQRNAKFIEKLINLDVLIIAGQAKSHCVAWTIDDLLSDIAQKDPALAQKVYLLEDCTSPVVAPGIIDFTEQANEAFKRFAAAGMNIVQSTTPLDQWPGINQSKL